MNFRNSTAICVLTMAGIGLPFATQAAEGFYVGLQGGASFLSDNEVDASLDGDSETTPVEVEFNTGFGVGGVAGYAFPMGLRVESEFTYRRNGLDAVTFTDPAAGIPDPVGADGHFRSFALMANGYYELDLGWPVMPYVGAGIGVARTKIEIDEFSAFGTALPAVFDDSDTVFAYQAMAGLAYQLMPSMAVGIEYRFFGSSGPDFEDQLLSAAAEVGLDGESIKSHNVFVNLRYFF